MNEILVTNILKPKEANGFKMHTEVIFVQLPRTRKRHTSWQVRLTSIKRSIETLKTFNVGRLNTIFL